MRPGQRLIKCQGLVTAKAGITQPAQTQPESETDKGESRYSGEERGSAFREREIGGGEGGHMLVMAAADREAEYRRLKLICQALI